MKLNKTQNRIVEAKTRGYSVTEDGRLIGIKGEIRVKLHGTQRYPTFSTNWDGYVYGLPVHQFAAYCFYGEKAFDKSLIVRHLDGDTLNFSKSNIVLGTHSENQYDKCPIARSNAARKARLSQGRSFITKFSSDDEVRNLLRDYFELKKDYPNKLPNGSLTYLQKKYNKSEGCVNSIVTGVNYKDLYLEIKQEYFNEV